MKLDPVLENLLNSYKLVSVTKNDFRELYVETLNRFVNFLKDNNQSMECELIIRMLEAMIVSLKRRRGYLLPSGADSETIFQQQGQWTFAVFTAALLKQAGIIADSKNVRNILSEKSFAWLQRNEKLFFSWSNFLNGNKQDNIFSRIIIEQPKLKNTKKQQKNCITEDFLAWMKQAILNEKIEANKSNSMIHRVEEGILLYFSKLVSVFSENHAVSADENILIENLNNQGVLIHNTKGSCIHTYCIGRWEDRHIITGIVVKTDALLTDSNALPINDSLIADPLSQL